jgi:hypothetical protein
MGNVSLDAAEVELRVAGYLGVAAAGTAGVIDARILARTGEHTGRSAGGDCDGLYVSAEHYVGGGAAGRWGEGSRVRYVFAWKTPDLPHFEYHRPADFVHA